MFRVDRTQNRLSRLVQKRFSDLAPRDGGLPRLMSGELRVDNARAQVEEVA